MDEQALAQLGNDTLNKAVTLFTAIEQSAATVDQLRDRIAHPDITRQELLANSPQALADVKRLVKIGDEFTAASESVRNLVGIQLADLTAKLQIIKTLLPNPANVTTAAIANLSGVVTLYEKLDSLRKSEIEFLRNFVVEFTQQWLNQTKSFTIGGEALKIKFTSAIGTGSPFAATASLDAELDYSVVRAAVRGVRLKLSGDLPVPAFDQAMVKPTFNIAAFANQIASAIAVDLPSGLQVKNPRLMAGEPPRLAVDARFAGVPFLTNMSFDATLVIATDGTVTMSGASGANPAFFFPIPGTVAALSTLGIGYDQPENKLSVATNIVPAADPAAVTVALRPLTVFLPVANLGSGIGFDGRMTLAGLECGKVTNGFLGPNRVSADVIIPSGAASPFGGASIFAVEAGFQFDGDGLLFNCQRFQCLTFLKGTAVGFIDFSGGGSFISNLDAEAFGARASFAAEWNAGFNRLVAEASASVEIDLDNLARFSVAAMLRCELDGGAPKTRVSATILGVPISNVPFGGSDLAGFLAAQVQTGLASIVKLIFDAGVKLVEELDPGKVLNKLRETFAKLVTFDNYPPAVTMAVEAGERIVQQTAECLGNPVKCAQDAAGSLGGIFGLGLIHPAAVAAAPNPFRDLFVPPDLAGIIDQIRDEFSQKFDFIQALADKLANLSAISKTAAGESPATRRRVATGFDLRIDQVVCGADGVDPAGRTISGAHILCLVKGSSYTRRGGGTTESSIAIWISLQIKQELGGPRATLSVQSFSDASLLNAAFWLEQRIRATVAAQLPGVSFSAPTPLETAVDLNFGQPPTGDLPVLGRFPARFSPGPTGCTLKFVVPGGCVANAGLKTADVIMKFNGLSLAATDFVTDRLTPAIAASVTRNALLEVLINETGHVKNFTVAMDPLI